MYNRKYSIFHDMEAGLKPDHDRPREHVAPGNRRPTSPEHGHCSQQVSVVAQSPAKFKGFKQWECGSMRNRPYLPAVLGSPQHVPFPQGTEAEGEGGHLLKFSRFHRQLAHACCCCCMSFCMTCAHLMAFDWAM